MIGFEVAPLAPRAKFLATKSGSMESSHSLVPLAIKDLSGELIVATSATCNCLCLNSLSRYA